MPLGKEVGFGSGHIVLDGDPVGTQRHTAAPPHFRPMPIVAKRSPISATVELLLLNVVIQRSLIRQSAVGHPIPGFCSMLRQPVICHDKF